MLSRNNTLFLSVHDIELFINQREKPMFRALNFDKYYK